MTIWAWLVAALPKLLLSIVRLLECRRPPQRREDLPPGLSVEGCDRGVLCLRDPHSAAIHLWNPTLKHLKTLTLPTTKSDDFCLGMGYEAASGDLKVIMVARDPSRGPSKEPYEALSEVFTRTSRVWVYSLKAEDWTTLGAPMPGLLQADPDWIEVSDLIPHCPVVVEGAVHWILRYSTFPEPGGGKVSSLGIVALDLATEVFSLFTPPIGKDKVLPHFVICLGTAFGCLALLCADASWSRSQIWVMEDYAVDDSWTKLASFDLDFILEATPCRDFLYPGGDHYLLFSSGGHIFSYNLATQSLDRLYADPNIGGLVAQYVHTPFPLLHA